VRDDLPTRLRKSLTAAREEGLPFEHAWTASLHRFSDRRLAAWSYPLSASREVWRLAYTSGHDLDALGLIACVIARRLERLTREPCRAASFPSSPPIAREGTGCSWGASS
jgi:hypothetical protein